MPIKILFFNSLTFQKGHPRKLIVGTGEDKQGNVTYYPLNVFQDLLWIGPAYVVGDGISIPTNFWYTFEMMDEDLENISKTMPLVIIAAYDGHNITLYLDGEMVTATPDENGKYYFATEWAVDFPVKKVV